MLTKPSHIDTYFQTLNEDRLHLLPELPWDPKSMSAVFTEKKVQWHHGVRHKSHVDSLNAILQEEEGHPIPLSHLIVQGSGALYNHAAEHLNHTLYWFSLAAQPMGYPEGDLAERIDESFGSLDNLRLQFMQAANEHFGSGWVWIALRPDRQLEVRATPDAGTPVAFGSIPLLGIDLWEHAYNVHGKNARRRYTEAFWQHIDWQFASEVLQRSEEVEI